jgi:Ca-activated chloride channel homolog
MRSVSIRVLFVLLLGGLSLGAQPSGPPVEPQQDHSIQVDVNVVNVPVTVTDNEDRFIVDLKKEDFEVYENGERVEIRYFTKTTQEEEEAGKVPPLRVGFLIDLSNTARLYYKNYKESIGDLAYMLVPEGGTSKGFLMGFHTTVDLIVDTTSEPYELATKMENLKHGGGSAMLDAAYMACADKLVSDPYQGVGEPRKIVVIVGDGHDNASKHSLEEVIDAAQRNQVTIYAVSTVAWGYHEPEEENLVKLVEATGGRISRPLQDIHKDTIAYLSKPQDAGNYALTVGTGAYAALQLEALYKAILAISGNVQSQYILGYVPPTPFSDRGFRKLEVKVKLSAPVQMHYRPGYYPPQM